MEAYVKSSDYQKLSEEHRELKKVFDSLKSGLIPSGFILVNEDMLSRDINSYCARSGTNDIHIREILAKFRELTSRYVFYDKQ